MNAKNQLLHPFFLLCLFLLLWNDFFLKAAFSNAFTGKLSDFAGLVVFPVFIAGLFPGLKRWTALATGILFVLWKTPLVSPVIDWLNGIVPFHIQRVIDYSDYWALLILPVAHRMLNRDQAFKWYNGTLVRVTRIGIAGIACFAICATTVLPRFGAPPGTIYIGKTYKIKKSEEEVIAMIRSLGYNVDFHSNGTDHPLTRGYYQTDNIVIYNDASRPIDTILNVKYNLYEQSKKVTQVEIINVTLREKAPIQKWQTLKFLSRQYRKALKQELIRKLN